jgi:hypothetical protein
VGQQANFCFFATCKNIVVTLAIIVALLIQSIVFMAYPAKKILFVSIFEPKLINKD